ncbi:hypothetical protein DTW90_05555 [Neorhizobium sp. P12A]|uniref:hypothetical protein n=1 Tax=Neorhizobium sp. P12A TaxID=2268027 RepID=UPI0011ECC2F3|nr:hypothetical protein [Neorhizobium sp. P12A]KAA0701064.1 hypothetical protein DTW90_05555 [Neorhizobium sp. P12A]
MFYQDVYGNVFEPASWFDKVPNDLQWSELFDACYHQGSITTGSYAVVPHIVDSIAKHGIFDWEPYALVAAIEEARLTDPAPAMPSELKDTYFEAYQKLAEHSLRVFPDASDPLLVRSVLAVLSLSKGQVSIATFAMLTESEQLELLGS